jgi:hypothetical protein
VRGLEFGNVWTVEAHYISLGKKESPIVYMEKVDVGRSYSAANLGLAFATFASSYGSLGPIKWL